MNEETTEPNLKTILEAIKDLDTSLNKRIDKLESKIDSHDAQFEAIRQGLIQNNSAFDRLEGVVYKLKGDVSSLKADIRDLTEEVHQMGKSKETLGLK